VVKGMGNLKGQPENILLKKSPNSDHQKLGGGFKDFLFSPLAGEMIQVD